MEQLLIKSSYFYFYKASNFSERLLFQQSYFFKIDPFSEQLLFQKRYFLQAVFFRKAIVNSIFFCQESYYFRAVTCSKELFFRNVTFQKWYFSQFQFLSTAALSMHQLINKVVRDQLCILWELSRVDLLVFKVASYTQFI